MRLNGLIGAVKMPPGRWSPPPPPGTSRRRPSAGPGHRAQAAALVFGVDLDHAAVDLVRQLVSLSQQAPVLVLDRVHALHQLVLGIGAQAQLAQQQKLLPVGLELQPRSVSGLVEEDAERPLGGDPRIELAQRPRRAVARVHESGLAGLLPLLVHADEVAFVDEHLPRTSKRAGGLPFSCSGTILMVRRFA